MKSSLDFVRVLHLARILEGEGNRNARGVMLADAVIGILIVSATNLHNSGHGVCKDVDDHNNECLLNSLRDQV